MVLDDTLHQVPRIFERQRRSRPNALSFEGFVPALDFSVRADSKAKLRHESAPDEVYDLVPRRVRSPGAPRSARPDIRPRSGAFQAAIEERGMESMQNKFSLHLKGRTSGRHTGRRPESTISFRW